eukprot:3706871-Rhodomonas_salina.1
MESSSSYHRGTRVGTPSLRPSALPWHWHCGSEKPAITPARLTQPGIRARQAQSRLSKALRNSCSGHGAAGVVLAQALKPASGFRLTGRLREPRPPAPGTADQLRHSDDWHSDARTVTRPVP